MTPGTSLAERLLRGGIPPSLLIDLINPEGMKIALAQELLPGDVAGAPPSAFAAGTRRTRSA